MLKKRLVFILSCVVFILAGYLLWNNILILDDQHPQTQEHFYSEAVIPQSDPGTVQDKPSVNKGYHIYINLDALTLYLYKNNQLVKTYPVSGGKTNTPSPVGTWKIIGKDTWGKGFGGAWMGLNVPWGKYGIHGTAYPWFVGKSNASKGCIRLKSPDALELYRIVSYGTQVTIVQHDKAFRRMKNGDIGSDVLEIQKGLREIGYYPGSLDGRYGNGLSTAVAKFQKANRLYANGSVNQQTYNLIKQRVAELE